MKATIEIPDELYRRVKAKSALEGRTVREVTTELYRTWVDEPEPAAGDRPFVSVYDSLRHVVGMFDSGVDDLATNPKYLEDLGLDSMGDSRLGSVDRAV